MSIIRSMPVLSVRVTETEDESLRIRAEEEGLSKSDLLRRALDDFLKEKSDKPKGIRKLLERGKDCVHPWSMRRHLASGVQCDQCGEWI